MSLVEENGGWRGILALTVITIVFSFAVSFGVDAFRDSPTELTCADWREGPSRQLEIAGDLAAELDVEGRRDGQELIVIAEAVDRSCSGSDADRPLVDDDFRGTAKARLSALE